jgi:alpha-glucosidase (family GH31 glycosyl hydrolase)
MGIETVWLLQMGISGIFFPETDIGGHWPTEELTDELFIRWAFLATFSPIMRSHGHNWRCRLPWGFGPENEARFVPLIKLRSAMFPYNYTLLAEANRHGTPMMRAMVLEFPQDRYARRLWDQFMWGPSLLVAPVYQKDARQRDVYLPEGTWVHYWTLARYEGPGRVAVDAPLGKDPLFVRAGSVLPTRTHSDTIPAKSDDRLTLLVSPGRSEAAFALYDDDRETYRYEKGESSRQAFVVSALKGDEFSLAIGAVEGSHAGVVTERSYRIEVPTSLARPTRVSIDGKEIPISEVSDATAPSFAHLGDRVVVELARTKGPVTVHFA